jgi:hypothetical protein
MFKRRYEYGFFNLMQVITQLGPEQATGECINLIYLQFRTLMIGQKGNSHAHMNWSNS